VGGQAVEIESGDQANHRFWNPQGDTNQVGIPRQLLVCELINTPADRSDQACVSQGVQRARRNTQSDGLTGFECALIFLKYFNCTVHKRIDLTVFPKKYS